MYPFKEIEKKYKDSSDPEIQAMLESKDLDVGLELNKLADCIITGVISG